MPTSNYPPCLNCDDYQYIGEGDAIRISRETMQEATQVG